MHKMYALFGYNIKTKQIYSGVVVAQDITTAVRASLLHTMYSMPDDSELADLCDRDCLTAIKKYYAQLDVVFELIQVPEAWPSGRRR